MSSYVASTRFERREDLLSFYVFHAISVAKGKQKVQNDYFKRGAHKEEVD